MEVELQEADNEAIDQLAKDLNQDPKDQAVRDKVWNMLQQGVLRRRKSKKCSA